MVAASRLKTNIGYLQEGCPINRGSRLGQPVRTGSGQKLMLG